jgi:predicted DCC family thiol-disulfide oxidoreductase YuxK
VIFDDNCRVCRVLMALVLAWDRRGHVHPVGFTWAHSVGAPNATDSWHIEVEGHGWHSAGAGVGPLLRALPGGGVAGAICARWPRGVERLYQAVAARRARLSRLLPNLVVKWADRVILRRRQQVR